MKSPWADLSAIFENRDSFSGLAILENSQNINSPGGWTLRHYGFLNPCFPGLEPFTLIPGEKTSAKYRVWIHRGNAEDGKVSSAYSVYDKPPKIEIIEKR